MNSWVVLLGVKKDSSQICILQRNCVKKLSYPSIMLLVMRLKTFSLLLNLTLTPLVFFVGSFSFSYTTVIALITKKEWRRILILVAGVDIHSNIQT